MRRNELLGERGGGGAPADAQVVQATLRPDSPTSSGTATTVKVEVKAPRAAVVISSPYAWAVYPPALQYAGFGVAC